MSAPRRPLHRGVKALVKARCEAKGWTLEEFAAKAKLTRPTLWRLLHQRAGPRDASLRGLAKALGLRVAERHTLLETTGAGDGSSERLRALENELRGLASEMGVEL